MQAAGGPQQTAQHCTDWGKQKKKTFRNAFLGSMLFSPARAPLTQESWNLTCPVYLINMLKQGWRAQNLHLTR